MPRINSLKIRKLGNVAPGTELKFDRRGVVLLGKNGTGKTTLLEILARICQGNLGLVAPDDYDIEISMSCENNIELNITARYEQGLTLSSANFASKAATDAAFSSLQQRARHQILRIEALDSTSGKRTLIESNDGDIRCTYANGEVEDTLLSTDLTWMFLGFAAVRHEAEDPLEDALYELVVMSGKLQRFDEGLDYFRNLTERSAISAHIEGFQQQGRYILNSTETRLISHRCARLLLEDFKRNEERSTSGFGDSSKIKYLELFCRLADFKRARIGAELDEKKQVEGQEVISLAPLRFTLERNGSVLHHHHLSFGQRRLLAFLHYHDSTPDLIIADELVNGMHHEWISECLRLMQNSQSFLSSQNPLLFDFLTFESPEEVANRFVICELDEQHRFVWRNMSESDAVEFYETHKVGLQHASEILRTRGYW